MKKKDYKRIAQFLYEMGTMRKLPRIHRQILLTDDMSDNIATHSYRVALIGWHLAKLEGVDPYKVTLMCLLHDVDEVRSNDHNWVHKRYTKVFEDEIIDEQLGTLPFSDFREIAEEYNERKTKEAIVAKDADMIDQLLLLEEYAWQGNKEAEVWLGGKGKKGKKGGHRDLKMIKTSSGKKLGKAIVDEEPSSWWNELWTSKRR